MCIVNVHRERVLGRAQGVCACLFALVLYVAWQNRFGGSVRDGGGVVLTDRRTIVNSYKRNDGFYNYNKGKTHRHNGQWLDYNYSLKSTCVRLGLLRSGGRIGGGNLLTR